MLGAGVSRTIAVSASLTIPISTHLIVYGTEGSSNVCHYICNRLSALKIVDNNNIFSVSISDGNAVIENNTAGVVRITYFSPINA